MVDVAPVAAGGRIGKLAGSMDLGRAGGREILKPWSAHHTSGRRNAVLLGDVGAVDVARRVGARAPVMADPMQRRHSALDVDELDDDLDDL